VFRARALPALLLAVTLLAWFAPPVEAEEPSPEVQPPAVTSISPDEFSIYGGGEAVVTGSGFVGVTEVTAAGLSVGFTEVSPTELHISVPARVILGATSAPLLVTTANGTSLQQGGPTITWVQPPDVSSVTTDSEVGGPALLEGRWLGRTTSVTVDGKPTPFTVLDEERVAITLPPHAPGFVDVVLHTPLYVSGAHTRYYDPATPAGLPALADKVSVGGTYTPLVGDFDGNDVDDTFWYAPGSAPDYLWTFSPDGRHTSKAMAVGGTFRPVVGDFGFDGVDDILWYAPGSATDTLWDFEQTGGRTSRRLWIGGDHLPIAGDFGGDVSDDVLWYTPGSGPDPLWQFTYGGNGAHTTRQLSVSGTYRPVAGDFTGDGADDVAWYAPGAASDSIWDFNRDGSRSTRALSVRGTYLPVAGDFTRDGTDDILWYASGTASDSLWDFDGGGGHTNRAASLSGSWRIAAGDLTGGGTTDLVLHGPGPASDAVWFVSPVVR